MGGIPQNSLKEGNLPPFWEKEGGRKKEKLHPSSNIKLRVRKKRKRCRGVLRREETSAHDRRGKKGKRGKKRGSLPLTTSCRAGEKKKRGEEEHGLTPVEKRKGEKDIVSSPRGRGKKRRRHILSSASFYRRKERKRKKEGVTLLSIPSRCFARGERRKEEGE